ncbi:WcaF family extracellular polysaccharide biosynthesis acetyltransferase [Terriglobus sp. ADX1]|uniref:WcaF family extracellular polysaccharide biosynthesis acetyltransferase n=1 Tax=Terriglobus sp. ADX1 TaxID=2794063 RepID=UPI002FE560F4
MNQQIDLKSYDNSWYEPGRSYLWRAAWMLLGLPLFRSPLLPSSRLRVTLLRLFGASVGEGVVIHSEVVVKYPWHLRIGDDCWIGERAWIDNLTTVTLGNNACLSQNAYICTGNHDWRDPSFGLMVAPVTLGNGAWVGARGMLLPGVTLYEGAVAGAGSVVSKNIPSWQIYAGNPALFVRNRTIREQPVRNGVLEEVAG